MQIQCYERILGFSYDRPMSDQQTRSRFLSFEKSFIREHASSQSLTVSHRPVAGVLLFGKRLRRSIPRTGLPDRSTAKSPDEAEAAMSYTNAEDGVTVAPTGRPRKLKRRCMSDERHTGQESIERNFAANGRFGATPSAVGAGSVR